MVFFDGMAAEDESNVEGTMEENMEQETEGQPVVRTIAKATRRELLKGCRI